MNKKLVVALGISALALGLFVTGAQAKKTVSPAKASCVQSAVAKRETATIAAFDLYTTQMRNVLGTKKEALQSAWGKTVLAERRAALNSAVKNFKNSRLEIRKTYKTTQKASWDLFKDEQKNCGTAGLQEDNAGQAEENLI
ncbi:MAG: hypothetical protein Q7S57_03860 [bacterium]|nr:hypothetical protein [bacterium]